MESRSSLRANHNVISWLTTMTFENSFMILISKAESSYLEISLLHVPTRCNVGIPLPVFSEEKKYNMVIIIISHFIFRLGVQRTKIIRQGNPSEKVYLSLSRNILYTIEKVQQLLRIGFEFFVEICVVVYSERKKVGFRKCLYGCSPKPLNLINTKHAFQINIWAQ